MKVTITNGAHTGRAGLLLSPPDSPVISVRVLRDKSTGRKEFIAAFDKKDLKYE